MGPAARGGVAGRPPRLDRDQVVDRMVRISRPAHEALRRIARRYRGASLGAVASAVILAADARPGRDSGRGHE